jgi:hypothetical protein
MAGMAAKHSDHSAAGAPLRRARACAWIVFWLTASTSVLYNCYHALVNGHMPWFTGVPEGVMPLAVAIGVLEFSGAWRENKALQLAGWAVACGAMAWSAIAVDAVVRHGWALGLIGDTAALAAMYFILNGPTAHEAVAVVDRKVAGLAAAADAERLAREQAEVAHRTVVNEVRAEMGRRLAGAERALADAELAASEAGRRAETLARKLASTTGSGTRKRGAGSGGTSARKTSGAGARKLEPATAPEAEAGLLAGLDDLDTEAKVLALMDRGQSASKAGILAGVSDARGRQIARLARQLSATAPQDVVDSSGDS